MALLGLTFKPNTDDLRFAPSLDIAAMLKHRGVKLRVYDPIAMPVAKTLPAFKGAVFCRDAYDCVKGADAAALVSEWDEFKTLDFKRLHKLMRIPLILDGRNLYDPAVLRGAGFTYCSVGRP